MQHIETPAESILDSGGVVGVGMGRGGHKLWNETMERSMRHSKTPTLENKPGDVQNNDRDNKLGRHLISERTWTRARTHPGACTHLNHSSRISASALI